MSLYSILHNNIIDFIRPILLDNRIIVMINNVFSLNTKTIAYSSIEMNFVCSLNLVCK